MGSSGGVLIIVVLVNAVPKFDTRNHFWKLVFSSQLELIFLSFLDDFEDHKFHGFHRQTAL